LPGIRRPALGGEELAGIEGELQELVGRKGHNNGV
jgi:hypothetical protein